jgi:splicing factor 3B subunit 3
MATTSNMFLYSLTIQPPTTITQAIVGQFSGTKEQQILTASGSRLTLLRPDPAQGRVITLLSTEVFGIIRSIAAFRLAGSNKGKFAPRSPIMRLHVVIVEAGLVATRRGPP